MREIKVGDIVRLNSGGPNMLVVMQEVNRQQFLCFWGREGGLGVASFPAAALTIVF